MSGGGLPLDLSISGGGEKGGKNKRTASTCPSPQTTAVVRPLGPADTSAVCEEDDEVPTE